MEAEWFGLHVEVILLRLSTSRHCLRSEIPDVSPSERADVCSSLERLDYKGRNDVFDKAIYLYNQHLEAAMVSSKVLESLTPSRSYFVI